MSTATVEALSRPSQARSIDSLLRHDPFLGRLGLLMVALTAPTLVAMSVDPRTFLGVNVWIKPLKFEISLAIYLLTLALFARYLPAGLAQKRWYRVYCGLVIAAVLAEIAWIGGAAAMATASHFNTTPVGMALYSLMGLAAVLLTSASGVYAWQIARNRELHLPPVFRESVILGLGLVLPLTLLTAGTMSSLGAHRVGGVASDAGALALLGWARDAGDLRVSHFFATHAMHFIPAIGLLSATLFGGEDRRLLRVAAILFAALVIFTYIQALMGFPFLPWIG